MRKFIEQLKRTVSPPTFGVRIDKCGNNECIDGNTGFDGEGVDGEDEGEGAEGSAGDESGREGEFIGADGRGEHLVEQVEGEEWVCRGEGFDEEVEGEEVWVLEERGEESGGGGGGVEGVEAEGEINIAVEVVLQDLGVDGFGLGEGEGLGEEREEEVVGVGFGWRARRLGK